MDPTILDSIGNIQELRNELTTGDVAKLRTQMHVPAGICDEDCDGISFMFAIIKWEGFDPYSFYLALNSLNRPDIMNIALKLPHICVSEPIQETARFAEPLSMKTLLQLMRTEISQKEWQVIAIGIKQDKYDFESIIKVCLEKQIISSDLENLQKMLSLLDRLDVAAKIRQYRPLFVEMCEEEFVGRMKKALTLQGAEIKQWEYKLKEFLNIKNTMVTQMLGDKEEVSLSSVYVDLTIVKEKPRPVKLEDETTFNEIAYLRKIATKEIEITPIDFTEELKSYRIEKPEIRCLIGNPGCGKTFLSKRIALRFAENELKHISYSIAIPCRNTDWHSMETTRVEDDRAVTTEFVQEWLCLGLPVTSDWAKDLAKHLANSDGEGLLLIIDGLDEFTKKIQFEKSLLYSLLTRQTLKKSTIILTTRPGAWTDISSQHELQVDRFYQVLGFSPENRDIYFEKQIVKLEKLQVCKSLLSRYDEMNQLSLIPVNASLFAALLKEESVTINTLTQLYRELTCYLIRRQLSRMALKELAKVKEIELFDKCVLDCLYTIGQIALIGVASRELTSTERVTVTIDHLEVECHCLGLAHEFHTKESVGAVKKVWAFAHLTMQEFISAIFLKSTSWTNQCLSVRYIADCDEHFSVFRMVLRFLCGLLTERSAALLVILYRHSIPEMIDDIPKYAQLRNDSFLQLTGWYKFTRKYFQLNSILFECDSELIHCSLKKILTIPFSIYLDQRVLHVSPNEWICFIQSLQLVNDIKVLYVHTQHVNINQFESLMKNMKMCPVAQLVIKFHFKNSIDILAYTNVLDEIQTGDTCISIELDYCEITNLSRIDLFSAPDKKNINGLSLKNCKCSPQFLGQLANNVISSHNLEYLYLAQSGADSLEILPPNLSKATKLKGLYIPILSSKYSQKDIFQTMPPLSQFAEVVYPYYSVLSHVARLTELTYLDIRSGSDKSISDSIVQVLNSNSSTLRIVKLRDLKGIEWIRFLTSLKSCVNLVQLRLWSTSLPSDDSIRWNHSLQNLKSLLYLSFSSVTLFDAGLAIVCQGLAKHPSIRKINVYNCGQTSQSCEALTNLIPTPRQLEKLWIDNLSQPDPLPIQELKLAAEQYSTETYFYD